jgi:hypothetical protein
MVKTTESLLKMKESTYHKSLINARSKTAAAAAAAAAWT